MKTSSRTAGGEAGIREGLGVRKALARKKEEHKKPVLRLQAGCFFKE